MKIKEKGQEWPRSNQTGLSWSPFLQMTWKMMILRRLVLQRAAYIQCPSKQLNLMLGGWGPLFPFGTRNDSFWLWSTGPGVQSTLHLGPWWRGWRSNRPRVSPCQGPPQFHVDQNINHVFRPFLPTSSPYDHLAKLKSNQGCDEAADRGGRRSNAAARGGAHDDDHQCHQYHQHDHMISSRRCNSCSWWWSSNWY